MCGKMGVLLWPRKGFFHQRRTSWTDVLSDCGESWINY